MSEPWKSIFFMVGCVFTVAGFFFFIFFPEVLDTNEITGRILVSLVISSLVYMYYCKPPR